MAEKNENAEKKVKGPEYGIDLITSIPRAKTHHTKGQRIHVNAEAVVFVPATKKGVEGIDVDFFGTDPNDILRTKKTDKNGRTLVKLNFNNRFEGQKLIINARIKGTNIKKTVESYLIPDFGSGAQRFWRLIKYNWKKKATKITTYLSLTVAINILAAWALYANHDGTSAAILISALIGLLAFKVIKNKLAGVIGAAGIICLSYFFPAYFISSFKLTIWFIVTAGIFFYLLEELTYEVIVESDGGKPKVSWQKLKNFYPYYPAAFAALMVVFNLIQFINSLIFPETANITGPGMIISVKEYFNPNGQGETQQIVGSAKQLMDIVNWLIAGSVLVLYAIPGEFLGFFKSTRGIHEGVGIGVLAKELFGWIKKIFTLKGGK